MYSAWKASEPFFLSWIQWCEGRYKSICPTYYLVRGSFHYFIQAEMVYYLMNPLQFLNESPNYEWVKILREPGKGKSIMTTTEEDHRHLSKSQDHSPHILSLFLSLSHTYRILLKRLPENLKEWHEGSKNVPSSFPLLFRSTFRHIHVHLDSEYAVLYIIQYLASPSLS